MFEELGRAFPEERRRKGLFGPTTELIVAFDDGELAGYLEFCRDWTDDRDVYLSSVQIAERHRGGMLFGALIREAHRVLRERTFRKLTSNVQSARTPRRVRERDGGGWWSANTALCSARGRGHRHTEQPGGALWVGDDGEELHAALAVRALRTSTAKVRLSSSAQGR
ncbi:hypothetical protein BH09MYX1_BH09MYX1_02170 [soil metagenome]